VKFRFLLYDTLCRNFKIFKTNEETMLNASSTNLSQGNRLIKFFGIAFISILMIACNQDTSAQQTPLSENNYSVISNPLTTTSGDKIEVMELFWFGCGHCFALEPKVKAWLKDKPENASFKKVPAVFSARWEFHARAYYTMEALGVLDQTEEAFFNRLHVARKPINDLSALVAFLADFDITEDAVEAAYNSFAVDSQMRNAKLITAKSTARGVPALIVDGKYLTGAQLAGGSDRIFTVVNQLVEKAAAER
jgi:thiol:disulfide interchange protein DsbA